MKRLLLHAILLQFVKAVRSGDFQYIVFLTVLSPWMFSLNHYNYARWLPIHIRTMFTLKEMFFQHSCKESLQCKEQPEIFKNWAGPQSRTTKWKNERCWWGNWING